MSKAPGLNKSLFSEEDDDDLFGEQTGESPGVDIFSSSKPKNAGKESGPLDIGGATTSESTDSPDQKAVKEPASKKPVGGVSMFGGMDPFSAIKKKKAADEENTAPETVTSKPTKVEQAKPTKTADPLFGEEEEEEDDLFGGNSSKPPSKSVPQGDDLFGSPKSEDDLFNSSPPKPPVTQVSEDKPKKPAGAVSMFGGVDPFSAMKKKSPSSEEQTGSGKTEEEKPAVSSPPQDDLFGSPKSDDDLFGSVPKSPDIQESSKEIKPKKPPGAVSMFGGMDPFAARKTKTSTSSEDKDDSTVASPVNEMNIGINPAALLPGAAPPVKEPENVVVGFDVPAEAKTLHSANKDRAKIQTKRRPPSRRGRQSAGDTVQSIPNGLPEVHHDPPSETSGLPDLPPIDNVRVSPPSDLFGNDDLLGESSGQTKLPEPKISENQSNDLFSSDQDDLFSPKKEKKKSPLNDDLFSPAKKDSQSIKTADDDGDDDIFGTSSVKVRPSNKSKSAISNGETTKTKDDTKSEKKTAIDDDDEDIFATKPKSKKATDYEKLFDKDPVGKQGADNSNVSKESKTVEDDDDIFGNSSLGKSKAKDQEGKSEKKEEKNNKQEEEDDIFATTEKTTKKVRNRPKTKDEDLFKDDTDIFADVPASKPKEKKKKKVGEKKPGIFKDDVDDIFADVAAPKVKKEKKKVDTAKTKTKSVDISDIFDDPLK